MKAYYCYACGKNFAFTEPKCFYCQGEFVEELEAAVSAQLIPTLLAEQAHTRGVNLSWSGMIGPTQIIFHHTRTTTNSNNNNNIDINNNSSREEVAELITRIHAAPIRLAMDFIQSHLPADPTESILRPLFTLFHIPGDPRDYVNDPGRYEQVLDQIFQQQQQPNHENGMEREQIENKCPTVEKPASGECAICREGYGDGGGVRRLPCGHLFHSDCVVPWLVRVASCPMCRKNPNE